ncbi:MAG: hypothetical protein R6X10_17260 [Desulfobacterales bacterium]
MKYHFYADPLLKAGYPVLDMALQNVFNISLDAAFAMINRLSARDTDEMPAAGCLDFADHHDKGTVLVFFAGVSIIFYHCPGFDSRQLQDGMRE